MTSHYGRPGSIPDHSVVDKAALGQVFFLMRLPSPCQYHSTNGLQQSSRPENLQIFRGTMSMGMKINDMTHPYLARYFCGLNTIWSSGVKHAKWFLGTIINGDKLRLQSGAKYATYRPVFSALKNQRRVQVNITVNQTSRSEGSVDATEESYLLFIQIKPVVFTIQSYYNAYSSGSIMYD